MLKIRLTRDIERVNNQPALVAGAEYNVTEGAEIGPLIDDKPGFLTVDTGDGQLVIFGPKFELV